MVERTGKVPPGPALTEGGHREDNGRIPRLPTMKDVVGKAEVAHDARAEVFDEHIGPLHERLEELPTEPEVSSNVMPSL